VLGRDLTENFAGATVFRRNYLGAEADRGRPPACRDDLLEPIEGAAAHEQDVGGVDLQEFLLRMLASTLRRHRRDGALHDLEQGLLHTLALVANEYGRAGDELAHLVLTLAAERAMERFLGFAAADLVHLRTPTRYKSSQP